MSRATLIIHNEQSGEDVTAEFDVQTPDDNATINITPEGINLTTNHEPKVTTSALTRTAPAAPASAAIADDLDAVLAGIDPRDSESALKLLAWLQDNKRIGQIGTLSGGLGYLYTYAEPQGSSQAGYVPGGTTGGRMVDAALQQAKDEGKTPQQQGMCPKCYSAVRKTEDGSIEAVEADEGVDPTLCSADNGPHGFA